MNNYLKSGTWQLASTSLITALQLTQLIITTKFFTPHELGIIATLTIAFTFVQIFSDFGLTNYLIHKKDAKNVEISTFFFTTSSIGISIFVIATAAILVGSSGILNEYQKLIPTYAAIVAASSLGITYQAILIKTENIKTLSIIDAISKSIGVLAVIALIISTNNIISIPLGVLLGTIARSTFLYFIGAKHWKPSYNYDAKYLTEMYDFGRFSFSGHFINQLRMQFDSIIVGYYFSTSELGIYSIAKSIALLPANILNPLLQRITISIFSKNQKDSNKLANLLYQYYYISALLISPIFLLIAFSSEPLFRIATSQEFHQGSTYTQILSAFIGIRLIIGAANSPLAQALGKTNIELKWTLISTPIHITVITVSGLFGTQTMLTSLVVMQLFLSYLSLENFAGKITPIAPLTAVKSILNGLIKTAVPVTLLSLASQNIIKDEADIEKLLMYSFIFSMFYFPQLFKLAKGKIQ